MGGKSKRGDDRKAGTARKIGKGYGKEPNSRETDAAAQKAAGRGAAPESKKRSDSRRETKSERKKRSPSVDDKLITTSMSASVDGVLEAAKAVEVDALLERCGLLGKLARIAIIAMSNAEHVRQVIEVIHHGLMLHFLEEADRLRGPDYAKANIAAESATILSRLGNAMNSLPTVARVLSERRMLDDESALFRESLGKILAKRLPDTPSDEYGAVVISELRLAELAERPAQQKPRPRRRA